LAIVLILLAVLSPLIGTSRWLFGTAMLFTLIPAIFAGLTALPTAIQTSAWCRPLLTLNGYLPLASQGFGWIFPALIGAVIGWICGRYVQK